MCKFNFVILHYGEKALIDTFECIESIQENILNKNYKIIIVENGSNDNSSKLLKKRYKDNQKVDVLILKENLGFAKGNNFGCKYAIVNYEPKFLVVINNDTVIKQKEFLDIIEHEYLEKPFDILGPNIIDKFGISQNPLKYYIPGKLDIIEKEIKSTKVNLENLERKSLFLIKKNIKYFIKKNKWITKEIKRVLNKLRKVESPFFNPTDPVPLHGSALIFSKKYYEKYNHEIFYPETFLYAEEDILYYIAKRDSLTMNYQPRLSIYHKEDASTDGIVNSPIQKSKFLLKNKLNSLIEFRKLIIRDLKK